MELVEINANGTCSRIQSLDTQARIRNYKKEIEEEPDGKPSLRPSDRIVILSDDDITAFLLRRKKRGQKHVREVIRNRVAKSIENEVLKKRFLSACDVFDQSAGGIVYGIETASKRKLKRESGICSGIVVRDSDRPHIRMRHRHKDKGENTEMN